MLHHQVCDCKHRRHSGTCSASPCTTLTTKILCEDFSEGSDPAFGSWPDLHSPVDPHIHLVGGDSHRTAGTDCRQRCISPLEPVRDTSQIYIDCTGMTNIVG